MRPAYQFPDLGAGFPPDLQGLVEKLLAKDPRDRFASATEVLVSQDPALVPLETLPGRNHYTFPAAESPPWQWQVDPHYPGWSD